MNTFACLLICESEQNSSTAPPPPPPPPPKPQLPQPTLLSKSPSQQQQRELPCHQSNLQTDLKPLSVVQGLCDSVVSASGGAVRSVKVARHRGPNGRLLSAGFGFVECSSEQAARAALKRLQASSPLLSLPNPPPPPPPPLPGVPFIDLAQAIACSRIHNCPPAKLLAPIIHDLASCRHSKTATCLLQQSILS